MKVPDVKSSFKKLNNTRLGTKTPKFFRIARNIGLVASALGIFIVTSPVALPSVIISAGPILAWIGGTAATVSQFAKEN